MRYVLAIVALSVLLSGCGSSSPAAKVATSKQVASIVASHKQEILNAIAYEDQCSGLCLSVVNILARYQKIASMAGSLYDDLEAAKPVAGEVAPLVATTQATLKTVLTSWTAFQNCAATHAGQSIDNCSAEWTANEKAWRAMKSMLAAWSPYGA